MKKIKRLFSKIIASCIAFFAAISNNVSHGVQMLYGPPPEEVVVKDNPPKSSFPQLQVFIIPLIFVVGAIVYFKKSKSTIKRKIVITMLAAILTFTISFLILIISKI